MGPGSLPLSVGPGRAPSGGATSPARPSTESARRPCRPARRLAADHPARPEQVVDEQHPDQVVEIVEVDREAAVARLANGPGHRVDGQRQRKGDHVDTRRHDLPDLHVPQVVEGVDDELLLLVAPVGRSTGGAVGCAPAERDAAFGAVSRPATRLLDGGTSSRPARTISVGQLAAGADTTESGWYDSS